MKLRAPSDGRMVWKIFLSHLTIVLLVLVAAAWFISLAVRQFHVDHLRRELMRQANDLSRQAAPLFAEGLREEINPLARQVAATTATRVTIIELDGTVLGESERQPEDMEGHLTRPEIMMARREGGGHARRYSTSLRQEMLYVALPLRRQEELIGFVRLARPLTGIRATLNNVYRQIFAIGLFAAVLAGLFSLLVTRRLTGPLEDIRQGAEKMAAGDLQTRLRIYNCRELNSVAKAMNQMAVSLANRLERERREKAEATAIAESMTEGIVAVDADVRILSLNSAAAAILGIDREAAVGRLFQAVVQVPGLQSLLAETECDEQARQREVPMHTGQESKVLRAQATPLRIEGGKQSFGSLLVLHDITPIRKLENVRRQFVANVSHELRTPITAIRGALETIIDSALDRREDTLRFLNVALRHTLRFERLIQDLLLLSRLDQSNRQNLELSPANLRELLLSTATMARENPARRERSIIVECPPELTVSVNPTLFEQALLNLLDNAVNYSPADREVRMVGEDTGNGTVSVRVVDQGCGVDPAQKERIFERFYRVDSARSRDSGGTGLGLAIVKHVVQLHGGAVDVASTPGQGSVFTIRVPAISAE